MKKKIAKLLALGMSIALVFSLAACGGNGDTNESESQSESQSVAADVTDDSAVPASEDASASAASESSDEGSSANPDTPVTGGITSPGSDVNAAVTLYNNGVSQSGFTTANVQLKWGGSDAGILGDLNGPSLGNGGVATEFEKPRSFSVTPGAINAGDIASVSSADNGSTITMTFTLKATSGDASSQYGYGSYPYFITFADANQLVKEIGNGTFGLDIVMKEDGATLQLDGGTITATIDKASGKMTALSSEISGETVKGKATLSAFPLGVTATIWGSGSVTFS